jgi:hypothetical protein
VTGYDFLRRAARLGVRVRVVDGKVRLEGSRPARDELREDARALKGELLELFRLTQYDRPADAPGEEWERDCRGVLVNLARLRGGEHGPN